ncbi:MAG: glycosyltransferase 87 family protein, partial [Bryobacteraceae bacterium]
AACCVAGVWALGGAAWEGLALGQPGALLVLSLALAYWQTRAAQGAAVAAGFSLKLVPGAVSIVPLLRRDWRAVAVLVTVMIAGVLVPSAAIRYWMPGPPPAVQGDYLLGTPAVLNWSLPAVALRIADPPVAPPKLPHNWEFGNTALGAHLPRGQQWLSAGVAAGVLLAGLAALLLVCRGRLEAAQAPWAAAALISLSVAASPISWNHYQILQYPGLALLLCRSVRRRRWLLGACAVVLGAFLYQIPREVLRAYYVQHAGWTAASPATLYIWTSVAPVASLVLFAVLLRQLAAEAEPPGPRSSPAAVAVAPCQALRLQ